MLPQARIRGIATLAVVLLGAVAAVSWQAGWFGGGTRAHGSPTLVGEVPSRLPREGVQIQDVVLKPWTSAPIGAMSTDLAITAARVFANARPFPAKAIAADLTLRGSTTKRHRPVWVVTFTSPTAIDVNTGPPGTPAINVTHYSVAVNAVSGKFVLGFFER